MFCPSCGLGYTQKTNYCKRCGEDLSPPGVTEAPKKNRPNVNGMLWGVIAFSLTAMALFLTAYDYFRSKGLRSEDRFALGFVLLFLFVIGLLLTWQLARMVTASRQTGQNKIVEKHFIREIPQIQTVAPASQIPEVIDPSSVVEHTTRQMAGVYSEPKA